MNPRAPLAVLWKSVGIVACFALVALLFSGQSLFATPTGNTAWVDIYGDNTAVGDGILEFTVVVGAYNEAEVPADTLYLEVPDGFVLAEGTSEVPTPPLSGLQTFEHTVRVKKSGTQSSSFVGTFRAYAIAYPSTKEFTIGWAPVARQMQQVLGNGGAAFADVPSAGTILVLPQKIYDVSSDVTATVPSTLWPQGGEGEVGAGVVFLPIVTTLPEWLTLTATTTDTLDGPSDANLENVFQKVVLTAHRSSFPADDPNGNYLPSQGILLTFDVAALIEEGYHPDSLSVWTRLPQFLDGASRRWQPLSSSTYNPETGTVWAWADRYGEFVLGRGLR